MTATAMTAQELVTRRAEYVELIERLRSSVPRQVPPGAQLLVVSRGDDELLTIPGIIAGHFPQDADGRYAGHYPHDSDAAIDHLEAHRRGGAGFLMFPATSLWWLDHYEDLRQHLDSRYRRVRRDEDCVIYDIRPAEVASIDAEAMVDPGTDVLWGPIRGLVDALLPPDDAVMVLVRDASEVISLGTRPVERELLGAVLTGDDHHQGWARIGSRFVVIPHLSDDGRIEASQVARVLCDSHRLVARHETVCTVLERRPGARHLKSVREDRVPSLGKAGS